MSSLLQPLMEEEASTSSPSEFRRVRSVITDSFRAIQPHCVSVISLSHEWRKLESSLSSVYDSLVKRAEELERKEMEVELRKKLLEMEEEKRKEGSFTVEAAAAEEREAEERRKAVEEEESRVWKRSLEVDEREKEVARRLEAAKLKERRNCERSEAIQSEDDRIVKRCLELDRRRKEIEERFETVESKARQVQERLEMVESREKIIQVLPSKEMEIEVRFEAVELTEKGIEERFEAVVMKEKGIEERFEAVTMREKEIEERFEVVELREKGIEERFEAVELREKGIEERCKVVDLKEKEKMAQIEERLDAVAMKEKGIEERFEAVELREKGIEERCKVMDLKEEKMAKIDERWKDIEVREGRIEERIRAVKLEEEQVGKRCAELVRREEEADECCKAAELKAKEVDERCRAVKAEEGKLEKKCIELLQREQLVESKERDVDERFRELESKEEEIDERCRAVEAKEKQCDECRRGIEEEKRRLSEQSAEMEKRNEELNERCLRLDFKERHIEWCLQELESKQKRVNEVDWQAPGLEGNRVRMWCDEMESKQKEVEGLLEELGLKESGINDRSRALDLKEKLVDERCMAQELRKKEADERYQEVELEKSRISEQLIEIERRESQISERLKEVELKERGVVERSRALELKEKKVKTNKGAELRQKSINDRCERNVFEENRLSRLRMELERRKREMDDRSKARELEENQFIERSHRLQVQERLIEERLRELGQSEAEVMGLDKALEELEFKKKLITQFSDQINVLDKLVKEKDLGLDVKEKHLSERCKVLELKEKQNYEQCEALKLRQKELDEFGKDLSVKDKQIAEKGLVLELKEKELSKRCQEQESREKEINDVRMMGNERLCSDLNVEDGETLQKLLNDRVDEHGFMGEALLKMLKSYNDPPCLVLSALNGFFSPHLRKGDVAYTSRTVRSSCVLLLEQLMNMKPEVCKNVREKAEEMASLWRRKMQEKGESRIVVLGFLLLVSAFGLRPHFERNELKRLWEIVDQHRLAPQLRFELDLFDEFEESSMVSPSDIGLRHSDSVATDDVNLCSEIQSACKNMDSNGLRSYLNEHVMDYKLFPQKVVDALKSAPDPAKLVFDVLQCFNLPQATLVDKTSCIFLLEQLVKLQKHQSSRNSVGKVVKVLNPPLQITPDMKNNVLAFVSHWKCKLTQEGLKPLEVYGFLQFIATYKFSRFFDGEELLRMFKVFYAAQPVYWPEENPHLCRSLGLTKKIPGLIKSLIEEDRRLQAAKYICTFMEEHHFPLALLLKDHVRFIQQRVDKVRGVSKDKSTKKIKMSFELSHLTEVLQYIKDYKLELEFPPASLESQIEELQAMMVDCITVTTGEREQPTKLPVTGRRKRDEAKVDSPENSGKDRVKNRSASAIKEMTDKNSSLQAARSHSELNSHGMKKREASPPTSELLQQEKRQRVDALKSPDRPNIAFKIPSARSLFSSKQPQALIPRQILQPCSLRPEVLATSSEHPAQPLELSPTTNVTAPGAIYNVAVAPYGGESTPGAAKE